MTASVLAGLVTLLHGPVPPTSTLPMASPDEPAAVAAEALPRWPSWPTLRYLGADKQGRLFLLRGDTLEVFPARPNGSLGDPCQLQLAVEREDSEDPTNAAMDPRTGDWLVLLSASDVRWFAGGKEKALPPLDFAASAVALRAGTPVVAVVPLGIAASPILPGENPELIELAGTKWSSLTRRFWDALPTTESGGQHGIRILALGERHVASASGERLWLSERSAYRVTLVSPGGQAAARLVVGGGATLFEENSPDDTAQTQGLARDRELRFQAPRGKSRRPARQIRGLAEGPGGRLYVAVTATGEPGGLFLDRFDLSRQRLERVRVPGLPNSRLTVAAGKDGLYLATVDGEGAGPWRVTWQTLDAAGWAPVTDATLDDQPLSPPTSHPTRR